MNDERQNGRVLRLGQTRPETIPVFVGDREEPLQAWVVTNGRYPVSVAAELEDARMRYRDRWVRVLDDPATPALRQAAHELMDATREGTRLPPAGKLKELLVTFHKALLQEEATPRWKQRESDYQAYLVDILMALIPGLEEHEADMIGMDERINALRELGYLVDGQDQEAASSTDPPVSEASSTGAEPELASAAPMAV